MSMEVSIEDDFMLEVESPEKHEYHDGVIVKREDSTLKHNLILNILIAKLLFKLRVRDYPPGELQ